MHFINSKNEIFIPYVYIYFFFFNIAMILLLLHCFDKQNINITEPFIIDKNSRFTRFSTPNQIGEGLLALCTQRRLMPNLDTILRTGLQHLVRRKN